MLKLKRKIMKTATFSVYMGLGCSDLTEQIAERQRKLEAERALYDLKERTFRTKAQNFGVSKGSPLTSAEIDSANKLADSAYYYQVQKANVQKLSDSLEIELDILRQ
jgi:hypothetical protein